MISIRKKIWIFLLVITMQPAWSTGNAYETSIIKLAKSHFLQAVAGSSIIFRHRFFSSY